MKIYHAKSLLRYFKIIIFLLIVLLFIPGCSDKDTLEKYYVYEKQPQKQWQSNMDEWINTAKICSQFQSQGSRTWGTQTKEFAQSFIAHCDRIAAVQIKVYPVRLQNGWVRLELLQDEKGTPGNIMARTWLRIERDCPVRHGTFMTFPIKNVKVSPETTYWITVVEYPDERPVPGQSHMALTNAGMGDGVSDIYSEGKLLVLSRDIIQEKRFTAVNFIIISKAGSVPGIHEASDTDKLTLRPEDCRNAYWQDATNEWDNCLSRK